MIRLYIDKNGLYCYDTDKKKTKEVLLFSISVLRSLTVNSRGMVSSPAIPLRAKSFMIPARNVLALADICTNPHYLYHRQYHSGFYQQCRGLSTNLKQMKRDIDNFSRCPFH